MRRALVALAVLLALAALAWSLRPRAEPPIARAVCGGRVDDLDLLATGTLRLHRDLLPPGGPDDAFIAEAVALQLRHAFAVPHNDPAARDILTPDGPPHTLEILDRTDVAYGRDLTLAWPADPALNPESAYVRNALARGRVAADDPAIVLRWRARVRVASCTTTDTPPTPLRLPVPHDPYLLYWSIPTTHHVEQTYLDKRVVTFPCADPGIADYAHPEYLWYYWQPRRAGCTDLLQTPRDLGVVDLEIAGRRAPANDLTPWLAAFPADRPLRIVLVFGYLNHQIDRPDPAALRASLESAALDPEWGAEQYRRFLRRTAELLVDRTLEPVATATDVSVTITGALRRSGRPVVLEAHLTETDYLAPSTYAPRHAPLLLAALRDADAIVYAGHSGLGLNFSRANLERDTSPAAVADALANSPTNLVAFIGCYTYAYFGDDLARDLQNALFVYTGNSVADTADSTLHVLSVLDCLLAGDPRCDLPAPGPPGEPDFLIWSRAR